MALPDITLPLSKFGVPPWVVASLGLIVLLFLGALLWKILSSQEGFLFGYGNWVVGKWQAVRGLSHHHHPTPAPAPVPPQPTVTEPVWALKLERNVLNLSRVLDGDLAYLMLNHVGEWDIKLMRTVQTLVSGITRVVHPAGRCRCGFFVLGDDEQHLTLYAGEGYTGTKKPNLHLERSCAGRAFLTGEDYYCRDIENDPVYWQSESGRSDYRSIACVPVRTGKSVFGVICLDAPEPSAFTADDFVFLETFAAKLAVFCALLSLQIAGVCHVPPEEGV